MALQKLWLSTGTMRADMLAALPRLRRFCEGLCRQGSGDGDELMQATVERALARSHQFVPGTRVDSWLFRIAQNMFIDDRQARSAARSRMCRWTISSGVDR